MARVALLVLCLEFRRPRTEIPFHHVISSGGCLTCSRVYLLDIRGKGILFPLKTECCTAMTYPIRQAAMVQSSSSPQVPFLTKAISTSQTRRIQYHRIPTCKFIEDALSSILGLHAPQLASPIPAGPQSSAPNRHEDTRIKR